MPRHPLIMIMTATLVASSIMGAEEGEWLDWKTTNGKTARARLIAIKDGNVILELENGRRPPGIPLAALDADSQSQARREQDRKTKPAMHQPTGPLFVEIPGGRFKMGSPLKESDRITNGQEELQLTQPAVPADPTTVREPLGDIEPEHRVDITRTFWMKRTEVTWAEWNAALSDAKVHGYTDIGSGRNGYEGDGSGMHPVTEITWLDAVKWCNLKSQIDRKQPVYHNTADFDGTAVFKIGTRIPIVNRDADGYRLPTEAEWEYACREGGSSGSKPFYADLKFIAWYAENSGGSTQPVGTRSGKPHRYGLHDMHGNVAEWCWDWMGLLTPGEFKDPQGPVKGTLRVFRGGSWADPARCCRAAYRGIFSPSPPASCFVGFRPVCGSDPAKKSPEP